MNVATHSRIQTHTYAYIGLVYSHLLLCITHTYIMYACTCRLMNAAYSRTNSHVYMHIYIFTFEYAHFHACIKYLCTYIYVFNSTHIRNCYAAVINNSSVIGEPHQENRCHCCHEHRIYHCRYRYRFYPPPVQINN